MYTHGVVNSLRGWYGTKNLETSATFDVSAHLARRELPPPPDLPNFTVESEPEARPAPEERHTGTGLMRHGVALDDAKVDQDAAKVVRRLERAGYEAYLVGGCVRDLLLGGTPKDFDIATSARPDDVKALFRNCRVIGRRFRLAHVLFGGGKVIEVATFRKNPTNDAPEIDVDAADDLLIRSDNVFGEAHEDALRRDFTINALFYDLDRRQVLDWCGGMEHLQSRTIQTIGDPGVRFREDPVRILRAIKFAARADLGIAPDVYDAIVMNRYELSRAARPRIFEEIARLGRGGALHRSMWLLWEVGAMAILLPELSSYLDDEEATEGELFFRRLDAIDRLTKAEGALDDLVLWASILFEPLSEAVTGARDVVGAAHDFLEPIVARIAMPRRITDGVARIAAVLPRLKQGRMGRLVRSELVVPALDVLEIDCIARGLPVDHVHAMRQEVTSAHGSARGGPGRAPGFYRGGSRPARRG